MGLCICAAMIVVNYREQLKLTTQYNENTLRCNSRRTGTLAMTAKQNLCIPDVVGTGKIDAGDYRCCHELLKESARVATENLMLDYTDL